MVQKYLTWLTAILENLCVTGAFLGWANMYPILENERFFTSTCPQTNSSSEFDEAVPCKSQKEALSLVFTIASSVGAFSTIFIGAFFDRFGAWVTRSVMINTIALCYVLVAIANVNTSYILYIASPLVVLAGNGIFVSNSQTANLYPKKRSLYTISTTSACDSAGIAFLVMNKLYFSSGNYFEFAYILYFYAAVVCSLNFRTFLLMPKRLVPYVLPKNYSYGYKELCSTSLIDLETIEQAPEQTNYEKSSETEAFNPDEMTFGECLRKKYFYTGMIAVVIVHFTTSFYISNINMFMRSLLPTDQKYDVNSYTNVFGVLQCCGILFAPLNAYLVEYFRKRFSKTSDKYLAALKSYAAGFFMGSVFLIIMFICTLIPIAKVQIFGMAMQMLSKTCFFGVRTAFLTLVFPSQHFGKLYGLYSFACGLVLLLQYPLTLLLTRVLGENFLILNGCLMLVSCLSFVHPFYLAHYSLQRSNKTSKEKIEIYVNSISIELE